MINPPTSRHLENVGNEQGREIVNAEWERYDALAKSAISSKIEAATKRSNPRNPSNLHKFGVATFLLALRDAETLGKKGKNTLRKEDAEAYQMLELRRQQVQDHYTALMDKPDVRDTLRSCEAAAAKQAFGNPPARAKSYKVFLLSDSFWEGLRKEPAKERSAKMSKCLMRLNALDASAAEDVAHGWMGKELEVDPLSLLVELPVNEAEKAARDLLDFLAELPEVQHLRAGRLPPRVTSAPSMTPAAGIYAFVNDPKHRASIARSMTQAIRAPQIRAQLQRSTDANAVFRALRDYKIDGAGFLDTLTKSQFMGKGVAAFFSLWGLSAISKSFPPRDAAGRLKKEQLAASVQAGFGLAGSLPTITRFCADGIGALLPATLISDFKSLPGAAKVGGKVTALAPKIVALCDALPILGDSVGLYFSCRGLEREMKNKDSVGMVANIAGALSNVGGFMAALVYVGTGVACPPLVIGSLALALGGALLDGFFGESELTGKIKQHLETLGIFKAEAGARDAYANRLGSRSSKSVRKYSGSSTLPLAERLKVITGCIKGKTKEWEETTVWKMFKDTRSQPQNFIWLIEATDAARVADELEDSREAADLLSWTLSAYASMGRVPGRGFTEQLIELCKQHRWQPLYCFIDDLADDPLGIGKAFDKVPAKELKRACKELMDGKTGEGAETALCHLLAFASPAQLNEIFHYDSVYAGRVKSELPADQWKRVRKQMTGRGASKGALYSASHA